MPRTLAALLAFLWLCSAVAMADAPDVVDVYSVVSRLMMGDPDRRMQLLQGPRAVIDRSRHYLSTPADGAEPDFEMMLFLRADDSCLAAVATDSGRTFAVYQEMNQSISDATVNAMPRPCDSALRYHLTRFGDSIHVTDAQGTTLYELTWDGHRLGVSNPAVLLVDPPDATVKDVDTKLALVPLASGTFRLPTDASAHHWRIDQPHFRGSDVTLATDGKNWKLAANGGATIESATYVKLAKTVHLNLLPADSVVYVAGDEATLNVDGADLRVSPLARDGDGFVIPNGWDPPELFVSHPAFEPSRLSILRGALDSAAPSYPPTALELKPRYGPLSYWQFDMVAVIGALALAVLALRQVRGWRHRPGDGPFEQHDNLAQLDSGTQTLVSRNGHRYALRRRLGSGGAGKVFEAVDQNAPDDPPVAIKVMLSEVLSNPDAQDRFAREIQVSARLVHPSIVRFLDWGVWQTRRGTVVPFMVMERITGQTLNELLTLPEPQPPAVAVRWMRAVLEGLQVAHAAGVVHRDIKPDNLMLSSQGQIKILDFGLARDATKRQITRTGTILGTPMYMSPEHLNAKAAGPPCDIYSLGAVAYEMLAGQAPYLGEELVDILEQIQQGGARPLLEVNPNVPLPLAAIVMRMMAPDLRVRYADAGSVLMDLNTI